MIGKNPANNPSLRSELERFNQEVFGENQVFFSIDFYQGFFCTPIDTMLRDIFAGILQFIFGQYPRSDAQKLRFRLFQIDADVFMTVYNSGNIGIGMAERNLKSGSFEKWLPKRILSQSFKGMAPFVEQCLDECPPRKKFKSFQGIRKYL